MSRHKQSAVNRARTLARLVGSTVGIVAGVFYGLFIVGNGPSVLRDDNRLALGVVLGSGLAGAAFFALAAPLVTVKPYLWLEDVLEKASPGELAGATAGLVVALLVSASVAVLLSGLPFGIGFGISVVLAVTFVFIGVTTGLRRHQAFMELLKPRHHRRSTDVVVAAQDGVPVVVDTSVLIDGRIVDVVKTGFIQGRLLLATVVLEELQRIADSSDPLRRTRGRRGLSAATALQENADVVCEVVALPSTTADDVDIKLVQLARERQAALMTNDFNLNKLAKIQGIRVLNLNDLANAVKAVVTAGETMQVAIMKEGKEPHQGVGYLDDGTMVVVEQGREHINSTVSVTVSSVLQTSSGRIIFAAAEGPKSR